MPTNKRQTAKKCWIKELVEGRYIKREGWEPSYIETSRGKISRVNLMGVIIHRNEDNSLVIDDGSGTIQLRTFDGEKITEEIGAVVIIIGRPRVFNDQTYVVLEIIRKIDPTWLKFRKSELKTSKSEKEHEEEKEAVIKTLKKEKEGEKTDLEETETQNLSEIIIKKIEELDQGRGVRISDLLDLLENDETNSNISKLIERGDIFEIRPGVVKLI